MSSDLTAIGDKNLKSGTVVETRTGRVYVIRPDRNGEISAKCLTQFHHSNKDNLSLSCLGWQQSAEVKQTQKRNAA